MPVTKGFVPFRITSDFETFQIKRKSAEGSLMEMYELIIQMRSKNLILRITEAERGNFVGFTNEKSSMKSGLCKKKNRKSL